MGHVPRSAFKPGQSGNPKGRPPGRVAWRDRLTAEDRAKMATEAGCTPLQWLLSVMLDTAHPFGDRLDAAKVAAPYMHKKMPIAVEVKDPGMRGGFDPAKLAELPRTERLMLLTTLTKLGVDIGVQMPDDPTQLPTVVPGAGGKMSAYYADRDAKGEEPSPAVKRSQQQAKDRAPSPNVPAPSKPARKAAAKAPKG